MTSLMDEESDSKVRWHDTTAPRALAIDRERNRYPYSIVWGPLGPLTMCCPCVGHMAIADSKGKIHDFAGPYHVGVDDFMVGCVWRYAVISGPEDAGWDDAIRRADEVYSQRMHNICCDNWYASQCPAAAPAPTRFACCSSPHSFGRHASQPPSHCARPLLLGSTAYLALRLDLLLSSWTLPTLLTRRVRERDSVSAERRSAPMNSVVSPA